MQTENSDAFDELDCGDDARAYYKEKLDAYRDQINRHHSNERWRTYPFMATVETLARCNAACEFCPYPTLERKGTEMSAQLFEKIIDDLADADPRGPTLFTLSRVNEPFLDKRIFDFAALVETKFPKICQMHFTNASPLNRRNFDEFLKLKRTTLLKISFNDHRKDEYERVMQIPFERTLSNVREIHARKEAGEFAFPVRIGRVGDGTKADSEFLAWAKREFPLFDAHVSPRFDWRGKIRNPNWSVPDVGCLQWLELHILANGTDAFCCTDSEGEFGVGDAARNHVVHDIYNHPDRRKLREAMPSRRSVAGCATCSALA
ncbi:MAG: radical SAM protein [Parvularculaceae bacterium]|nr:radical SAM protein [Parvularculaceae bacterium]